MRDYDLTGPIGMKRLLTAESGKIYTYYDPTFLSGGTSPMWRLSYTLSRPITEAFYWNPRAENLYFAQESASGQYPLASVSSPSLPPATGWTSGNFTLGSDGDGVKIHQSALVGTAVSTASDKREFLLLATSAGPLGAFYGSLGTIDLSGFTVLSNGWADATTGSVITSRRLTKTLAVRDRNGAYGKFALIGGQGLFVFRAANCNYDGSTTAGTKATFESLSTYFDDPSIVVTALAQRPESGSANYFLVAVSESAPTDYKLYSLQFTSDGGLSTTTEIASPDRTVNDLMYVKVGGYKQVILAATDAGLYISDDAGSASTTWSPYLQNMLGGYQVNRLIDYNGRLGVLAEGNGLIYGPYPQ